MTTNNGTVNLKGKTYFTVARRVRDFRATHPIADGWGLSTSIITCDAEVIIFRAAITDPSGREVANGFAEEKRSNRGVNSTSALENAETSAIGRALAAAGLGGDGEYASADELVNALSQQRPGREPHTVGSVTWAYDALKTRGLEYGAVDAYINSRGWKRLKDWLPEKRQGFVAAVKNGEVPALNPKQDGAA